MSLAGKARLRMAAVALVAFYIEISFGTDLRLWGVAPDLLSVVTIAAALSGGAEQGAFCGFGCGLLVDLYLTDTPFGLSALCLCLIGFVVGSLRAASPMAGKALIPVVVMAATALEVGLFLALAGLVSQADLTAEGTDWVVRVVVIESLDAAVLSLPVCHLLRWASRGSSGAVALGGPAGVANW